MGTRPYSLNCSKINRYFKNKCVTKWKNACLLIPGKVVYFYKVYIVYINCYKGIVLPERANALGIVALSVGRDAPLVSKRVSIRLKALQFVNISIK